MQEPRTNTALACMTYGTGKLTRRDANPEGKDGNCIGWPLDPDLLLKRVRMRPDR